MYMSVGDFIVHWCLQQSLCFCLIFLWGAQKIDFSLLKQVDILKAFSCLKINNN